MLWGQSSKKSSSAKRPGPLPLGALSANAAATDVPLHVAAAVPPPLKKMRSAAARATETRGSSSSSRELNAAQRQKTMTTKQKRGDAARGKQTRGEGRVSLPSSAAQERLAAFGAVGKATSSSSSPAVSSLWISSTRHHHHGARKGGSVWASRAHARKHRCLVLRRRVGERPLLHGVVVVELCHHDARRCIPLAAAGTRPLQRGQVAAGRRR